MKLLIALFLLFLLPIIPVYGLETPGLKQSFFIETDGHEFKVITTSNFEITSYEFDKQKKQLTFFINSGLENNLSEIIIPINLINGNFTFYLNEQEIFPKVLPSDKISFITVKFTGSGIYRLDIIGTTYLPEFSEITVLILATSMFGLILLKTKNLKRLFTN